MINIDLDARYAEDPDLLARALKAMRELGYTDEEINKKLQPTRLERRKNDAIINTQGRSSVDRRDA